MKKNKLSLIVFVLFFSLIGCSAENVLVNVENGGSVEPAVTVVPVEEKQENEIFVAFEHTAVPIEESVITSEKTEETQAEKTEISYIGNKNTKKFHLPTCKMLPKEKNRIIFSTQSEALEQSFALCKKCNP